MREISRCPPSTGTYNWWLLSLTHTSQDIKGTRIETVPIYTTSIISNSSPPCNIPTKGATLIGQTSRQLAEGENFYFSHHFSPPRHAMHACRWLCMKDRRAMGKKLAKQQPLVAFATSAGPLPDALLQKSSALGTHCFCGSASLGCRVLRFAINTC